MALILAPFGLLFVALWGSKIDPNSSSFLSSIFVRFGSRFGAILGPKRRPKGTQEHPKGSQECQKGTQEHPKSSQEHQKDTQEHPNGNKCLKVITNVARFPFLLGQVYLEDFFASKIQSFFLSFLIALGHRFGAILAPFLAPKSIQNRPKIGPRRLLKPFSSKNVIFQNLALARARARK